MSQLQVIWRVGARQPVSGNLPETALSITQGLQCVVKDIDVHRPDDTLDSVCSIVEFDDQWQVLLEHSVPDVIYLHSLPSNELLLGCEKWLAQTKMRFPAITVVLNADIGTQVPSPQYLTELAAQADLMIVSQAHLTDFVTCSTPSAVTEIVAPLREWLALSGAAWLVTDDGNTAWFIDKQQALEFSALQNDAALLSEQNESRVLPLLSFLAHGYDLLDSITMMHAYIASLLNGEADWPQKTQYLPTIRPLLGNKAALVASDSGSLSFAPIDLHKFGLYPVVDTLEWLSLVLKNGAATAQLRIKDPSASNLDSQIKGAVALGKQYNAQVFINDYWQKAIEHGAFGIHLGQEDLEIADLTAVSNAGLALGISTHGYFEIANAMRINPSYIALGHIFPTQTKDMPSQPQGLVRLGFYARLLKGIYPTVAIGGISAERVPAVLKTGVDSVALVTAITKAADPEKATQDLLSLFSAEKAVCL